MTSQTAKPTAELIAELRLNSGMEMCADLRLMWTAADRLETILKAWEAYDAAPYFEQARALSALQSAITGTEVRG